MHWNAGSASDAASPGFRRGLGGGVARRAFLADMGLGFTGLALGAMLHRDGLASTVAWAPPDGKPHFAPRAKSVIWLFMNGGVSHMESFDPKPEITKYAGKTIANTPYADVQSPEKLGPGIAAAFTATIYGIGVANLFLLPVASKLKQIIAKQTQAREMVVEGLASIAEGDNPRIIEAKLQGYLTDGERPESSGDDGDKA